MGGVGGCDGTVAKLIQSVEKKDFSCEWCSNEPMFLRHYRPVESSSFVGFSCKIS